jgi:uncharacterized repeat protein (TIGR02543 family)
MFAVLHALGPGARAQAGSYASEPVLVGAAGYQLNFLIRWTCDDDPSRTVSDPGRIDLVDGGGNIVAQVLATASASGPGVSASGAGSVSGASASIHLFGAGGTPADGLVHGTWTVTGLSPGAYAFRFWLFDVTVPGNPLSAVETSAIDAGGGGPLGGIPTPSPTPTPPPPSVVLTAPPFGTALQTANVGATASVSAGGRPLASVVVDASWDGGASWAVVATDTHPSSPSDSLQAFYSFPAAGTATLRATATDSGGLTATSTQAVAVARAAQGLLAISPAAAAVNAGQSVAFTASGGSTGNYAWGGQASGTGAEQTVTFPAPGAYAVTVIDTGNANFLPSASASAAVAVQSAFYSLSVSASGSGSVSGGGSYPPNSQATATASPGTGSAFTGWTGDVTASTPSLSILMSGNRSVMAHFTALLPQSITFVPPGAVTTRTPAFALAVSSSSGLPVSLALDSGPAALAGDTITPSGATGEVTLTATQPGNTQYLPAEPVVITFAVGPPPPGVHLSDDSAATKKSDKDTRATSYMSDGAH